MLVNAQTKVLVRVQFTSLHLVITSLQVKVETRLVPYEQTFGRKLRRNAQGCTKLDVSYTLSYGGSGTCMLLHASVGTSVRLI